MLCLAAAKDYRLIHEINQEFRKTFLEINFLRLIHLEISLKDFHLTTCKEIEKQYLLVLQAKVKTSLTSEDGQNYGTVPMPTFASRPLIAFYNTGGQGDGVPKAGVQQAAADSRGSRTCMCANTFMLRGGTRRGGRMN